ncbi:hypothetical protein [Alicyclobacillus acidoterrestris]|uniref:Uncharacterized protein n=1 Tax=Alicyclobacillus acidoterrestris (strain ATCC 49025 / DSM 3922 / CIP 106132 / NCIMB 13137 / GD3B) TaxID=1356854 RepID=T0D833_ALIAG|nr:hypothetical protein [Alicyclobacillus acidoterrestris]EPZ47662.1 hypothetical protein N007_05235 [Alicyclobacillus acidoterrestris ATCC 49025]UNO48021.1 hypothetical protein K1I37_15210 [Alicyclobacillus acidoterrestris]
MIFFAKTETKADLALYMAATVASIPVWMMGGWIPLLATIGATECVTGAYEFICDTSQKVKLMRGRGAS